MIPAVTGFLDQDFIIEEQPSLTYKMEISGNSARGTVDGKEAMEQTIFRILNTERYRYIIYPWYYGIETMDLYGEPVTFVCPELERRITEALLTDTRIVSVTDFQLDLSETGVIQTSFTVHTVFGLVTAQKEVHI